MRAKAAVLEAFDKPLTCREFDLAPLQAGEVRVKIAAAGVCGSDVHMWHGHDPRTPLPMILGHEGVGVVHETAGPKVDLAQVARPRGAREERYDLGRFPFRGDGR